MALDKKDVRILDLLKEDSSLKMGKIAKKTNIPVTTVHNRIKRMEREGIIAGYTVKLNHKKLDEGLLAYLLVTVNYLLPDGKKVQQLDIAKNIKKLGAEEVSLVTGGTDILVKVRTKDVDELNTFIIEKLRNVNGVDKTQTMIVLSQT